MSGDVLAAALALAWAVLVAGGLVVARPRRRVPIGSRPGGGPGPAGGPLAALGARLRRWAGRLTDRPPGPAEPAADVWIGAAAVLTLVLLVVAPVLAPLPVAGGAVGPRLARRRAVEAERRAWADALPDAVDLLALGLGSGLAVAPALALAAPRTPEPLGSALARAHDRVVHGAPLPEALEQVAERGPASRPLVALLVAAHRDGAPVVDPLTRLAGDLRADRRRAVEARARQVPVRLLFPLVLCSLPAFVLLAIVPPVVAAISDLRA
ncbi:MAG TPA: type II secretion system F family protein [Iamia sp.]